MLRKLASRPHWQIALTFTVVLRVVFSAIAAALSFFLHPSLALIRSNAFTENLPTPGTVYYALLGIWERFDTLWYLHIAQHGYDQPMGVIFYPLYPAMIRVVSAGMPYTVASLVISTVAAFFCFWGLLRLAEPEHSELGRMNSLLWLGVWPSSFVLFAGYAESLTLALIVWAVIWAREQRWELATLCGFLAGTARPSGVLVFIPLAVMALRSRQARALVVALTPLGLLSYWGWLRWSGRIPVVEAYRLYQGMTMVPPWMGLAEVVHLIVVQHDVVLAIKLGLLIAAAVVSLRPDARMRMEDRAFTLAIILQMFMYTGRPLLGAWRYMLMMYPMFLISGAYNERWNTRRFRFCLSSLAFLNLVWMWAFLNWLLVL